MTALIGYFGTANALTEFNIGDIVNIDTKYSGTLNTESGRIKLESNKRYKISLSCVTSSDKLVLQLYDTTCNSNIGSPIVYIRNQESEILHQTFSSPVYEVKKDSLISVKITEVKGIKDIQNLCIVIEEMLDVVSSLNKSLVSNIYLGEDRSVNAGDIVPFVKNDGDFKLTDGIVTIPAGVSVQISINVLSRMSSESWVKCAIIDFDTQEQLSNYIIVTCESSLPNSSATSFLNLAEHDVDRNICLKVIELNGSVKLVSSSTILCVHSLNNTIVCADIKQFDISEFDKVKNKVIELEDKFNLEQRVNFTREW